jgi:hypothetical protein
MSVIATRLQNNGGGGGVCEKYEFQRTQIGSTNVPMGKSHMKPPDIEPRSFNISGGDTHTKTGNTILTLFKDGASTVNIIYYQVKRHDAKCGAFIVAEIKSRFSGL